MTGAKWICSAQDYPWQPLQGILINVASFHQWLVKYLWPHHLIAGCNFMNHPINPLRHGRAPSSLSFSTWGYSKTIAGWKVRESCTTQRMLSPWKHGPELLSLAQPTRSNGWLECQGCPVALVGGGGGTFIKSSGGERVFSPRFLSRPAGWMWCFWLRGLKEWGRQSVGNADSANSWEPPAAASSWFSSTGSSWAWRGCFNGKLAGREESIPSLCTEWIKSWSVLDSSFQEKIARIVSLENKTAKREKEGGSSPCTLQLSWLRGSFARHVSATFDFWHCLRLSKTPLRVFCGGECQAFVQSDCM